MSSECVSCSLSTTSARGCSPSTCWAWARAPSPSSSPSPSPGTSSPRRAGTATGRCTPGVTTTTRSCSSSPWSPGRGSSCGQCRARRWFSTVSRHCSTVPVCLCLFPVFYLFLALQEAIIIFSELTMEGLVCSSQPAISIQVVYLSQWGTILVFLRFLHV